MTDTGTRKLSTHRIREIVEALEEQIVLGWLLPRERLVEDKLAAEFDCKKHVVREVIFELERMGLVEHVPNKGATVRVLSPLEVQQIYSVREALEVLAAEQIPLPGSPDFVEALTRIQQAHAHAVDAKDYRAAFHANMEFHNRLFSACGNPYLAEMIRNSAQKVHGARFYTSASDTHLSRARDEHAAMVVAISNGDREALVELCRKHLGPSLDTYLAAVRGVFRTTHDVEATRAVR
ncbi:GntR family transcriptional regulator [Paraburkholderia silvatlantica]|uniref:GntR family transcriptional regulator n=1 Tax=Paraburkholderia silvatlantica TaxID=321895 RepID=UPI003751AE03